MSSQSFYHVSNMFIKLTRLRSIGFKDLSYEFVKQCDDFWFEAEEIITMLSETWIYMKKFKKIL